jgi:hypothetical protein
MILMEISLWQIPCLVDPALLSCRFNLREGPAFPFPVFLFPLEISGEIKIDWFVLTVSWALALRTPSDIGANSS